MCWSTNRSYFKLYLPIFAMNLVLFLVFIIAVLSPRCSFSITSRKTCTSILVITVALLFDYLWFTRNLLSLCGDVELNPGPNQNTTEKRFICQQNLNSIGAHSFARLVLLKAYNSIHKFDVTCLSETYILIPLSYMVKTIWKYHDIIQCVLLIRQIKNVEVCVFTIRVICP